MHEASAHARPARRDAPRPSTVRWAGALALALLLPACGTSYVRHARADLSQVLHAGLGVSAWPGLFVEARAPVFATSAGWQPESYAAGSDYGAFFAWRQRAWGFLLGGRLARVPLGEPLPPLAGRPPEALYLDHGHFLVLGLVTRDDRTPSATGLMNVRKVEVGAHVLFVGASLGIDLAELLDALAGLAGWDLLGDDLPNDVARGHLPPEALPAGPDRDEDDGPPADAPGAPGVP